METKFNVYRVYAGVHYGGFALVGANSAEEANVYITDFKESDKNNTFDSLGYGYVTEEDKIDGIWSKKSNFIMQDIYYRG